MTFVKVTTEERELLGRFIDYYKFVKRSTGFYMYDRKTNEFSGIIHIGKRGGVYPEILEDYRDIFLDRTNWGGIRTLDSDLKKKRRIEQEFMKIAKSMGYDIRRSNFAFSLTKGDEPKGQYRVQLSTEDGGKKVPDVSFSDGPLAEDLNAVLRSKGWNVWGDCYV